MDKEVSIHLHMHKKQAYGACCMSVHTHMKAHTQTVDWNRSGKKNNWHEPVSNWLYQMLSP